MSDSSQTSESTAALPVLTRPEPKTSRQVKKLPPYNVVLHDDNQHTYDYVVEMLKAIFSHPQEMGMVMAKEVDSQGRVIVLTTHKELAELKRDQIHSHGGDWRIATCKGSMSASIEPAEE